MSLDFSASAKVNQEYALNCEIRSKLQYYQDEDKNGKKFNASTEMFFLVPMESTAKVLFFDAWLPSVTEETYEVAGIIHSPINKALRLGVKRANENCQEHHLFVMTEAIDEELRRYIDWARKEGSSRNGGYPTIKLTILPQDQEEKLDV